MPDDALTVFRHYVHEHEARLAAAVLEAHDVPTRVIVDNAGGALPSMALVFPIRLLVRVEDAARAAELLDTPADEPDEWESSGEEE